MQTTSYKAFQIVENNQHFKEDNLVIESALQININNEPYTVVMRTPGNDIDLVIGLLFAEDIYKKNQKLKFKVLKKVNNINSIINVDINKEDLGKGYLNKRTLLSVSSCGICGKKELKDVQITGENINLKYKFNKEDVFEMMQTMFEFQQNFKKSGGSHAAAIFNKSKKLISLREDIGRHNAVDKTIGDLQQKEILKEANFLCVSGRVSYEIVTKAFIAKIPIIVAVSACSTLAVDFAKEFGICLIGFTRANKMTIYANPQFLKIMEHV